ncbi:sulfotransferase [Thioalkalivibrio nitratireducens]|uniref:sulfotransferase n=1 Tax=Thioalkalivibrio nitratireducens TaxID=186931 RepID=UPI001F15BEB8|nr:sulfotransferase [Thioalkalivibrio nitratireducens]
MTRKLREFPYLYGWPYLTRYLKSYARKYVFGEKHAGSWGVRYKGIDRDLAEHGIEYVATRQWAKCVRHSCDALGRLQEGVDYINVSFEEFVTSPEAELERILEFILAEEKGQILSFARSIIDPSRSQISVERNVYDGMPEIGKMVSDGQKAIETLTGRRRTSSV